MQRIRVLDEGAAHERRREVREPAVVADRPPDRPAVRPADLQVRRAERRRQVDDPRAVLEGDEVAGDHRVRALDVRVRRLVARADQRRAATGRADHAVLAQDGLPERRGEHQPFAADLDLVVVGLRVHGDAGVRREGPRRRRPDHERGAHERGIRRLHDRQSDEHARVDRLRIAERHLRVGQGRAAARAVRGDLVVFDQQPAAMELLQRPPHRLDVVRVHRPVGVGHVDPEADPSREAFQLADVAEHRLAAQLVERGHAERLDVLLPGRADLLLDLDLDRQSVAVPAALAGHEVTGHRLEPRIDVLERARPPRDGCRACRSRWGVPRRRSTSATPSRSSRERRKTSASSHHARICSSSSGKRTFGSTVSNAVTGASRHTNASSSMRGRGVGPAVPPRLPDGRRPLIGLTASRSRAGSACAYRGSRTVRAGSGRGSGRMPVEARHRLPPSRLARAPLLRRRVPVVAVRACYPNRRSGRNDAIGRRTSVRFGALGAAGDRPVRKLPNAL